MITIFQFQDERICDDQTAQNQHQRPISAEDHIIYNNIISRANRKDQSYRNIVCQHNIFLHFFFYKLRYQIK